MVVDTMDNSLFDMKALERRTLEQFSNFSFPEYEEIPDVGLYLKQVVRYIAGVLEPLGIQPLTASMISNYVKQGLIDSPEKKMYFREQIALLMYIAVTKNVLSMEQISYTISLREPGDGMAQTYKRMRSEMLGAVANLPESGTALHDSAEPEEMLLHNTIILIIYKIFLDKLYVNAKEFYNPLVK